jgi:hypothetical protein
LIFVCTHEDDLESLATFQQGVVHFGELWSELFAERHKGEAQLVAEVASAHLKAGHAVVRGQETIHMRVQVSVEVITHQGPHHDAL